MSQLAKEPGLAGYENFAEACLAPLVGRVPSQSPSPSLPQLSVLRKARKKEIRFQHHHHKRNLVCVWNSGCLVNLRVQYMLSQLSYIHSLASVLGFPSLNRLEVTVDRRSSVPEVVPAFFLPSPVFLPHISSFSAVVPAAAVADPIT